MVICLGMACLSGCGVPSHFALHDAIQSDEVGTMNRLVKEGLKPDGLIERKHSEHLAPEERGRTTPLIIAVRGSYGVSVRELLSAGANPNLADENGTVPLMVALERQNLGILRLLLEAGADPNVIDRRSGQTPLMKAVDKSRRHQELELLLKHGARPNLITPEGKSALDVLDLEYNRQRAARNEGLKLLKQRGFKIRLIAPTTEQIKQHQNTRDLYKRGLIARPY